MRSKIKNKERIINHDKHNYKKQLEQLESSLVKVAYVISKEDGQIYMRAQAFFDSNPQFVIISGNCALRYGQTLKDGFLERVQTKDTDFAIIKDSKDAILTKLFDDLQETSDVIFVFSDEETPSVLTELDDGNYLIAVFDGVLRTYVGFLKFMDGYEAFKKEMLQKSPQTIYGDASEIVFAENVKDCVENNVESIPGYCYANDDDVGDILCAFANGKIAFPTLYNEFLDIYRDGRFLSLFSDVELFFREVLRRLEEDDD